MLCWLMRWGVLRENRRGLLGAKSKRTVCFRDPNKLQNVKRGKYQKNRADM